MRSFLNHPPRRINAGTENICQGGQAPEHGGLVYLKRIILWLLMTMPLTGLSQADSCPLRISLLTCAPGEELYTTFGHTAIRVQDARYGVDDVYNYGTFYNSPDFYIEFVLGKLKYALSTESFASFTQEYAYTGRAVQEQDLKLDCTAKDSMLRALQRNAQEENRYYLYDFLFNNCTTRAGRMIQQHAGAPVTMDTVLPRTGRSFRQMLHHYLDNGGQQWSKFGIDLLLGSRLDKKVTPAQALFLPDYLLEGIDSATAGGRLLAAPPVTLVDAPGPLRSAGAGSPLPVFTGLFLLISLLSFLPAMPSFSVRGRRYLRRFLAVFDFFLFAVLGLAGCLLLFMWWGTDHAVCRDNWNLLWALPTHLLAAPLLRTRRRWLSWYLLLTMVTGSLLLLLWPFLPQALPLPAIPLILLVLLRSWFVLARPYDEYPQATDQRQESGVPR